MPVPQSVKVVIAWDSIPREGIRSNVVLPDLTFAETQGSYTNVEGTVQFLRPVLPVTDPMREGWDVLSEIGRGLGVTLDFTGVYAVQRAAAEAHPQALGALADPPAPAGLRNPTVQGPARP